MTQQTIEGGCLCGAVRYGVVGAPSISMICHCHSCASASGAPAVAWLTFPVGAFAFIHGKPETFRSSPPVVRRFCGSCGTALTYEHATRPSEIDVTTCSLDDPNAFPPTHHAWIADGPRWARPTDGLPAYERGTPA
jgi:hypothetical protein